MGKAAKKFKKIKKKRSVGQQNKNNFISFLGSVFFLRKAYIANSEEKPTIISRQSFYFLCNK